ncbi:MAG: hypothetical protein C0432_02160 [Candidatus Puniceispirillum sp.]|nr:hypothetical protein [Candidatus Pelagibacter sp.]MBA4283079.1 hypothetical protein [Candidatus Puniceispirillum sp.]
MIPLSSNIGILIAYRILLVNILSDFDESYSNAASHILVVLGLLAFPYYFSTGTALQIKRKITEKLDKNNILNTIYVSLFLNLVLSLCTSLLFYFFTQDALQLLSQPPEIISPTVHFVQNYSKGLIFYSLIHCFQHILIGLNRVSHSSYMNIFSHAMHLFFIWGYFTYLKNYQGIEFKYLDYSWHQPLIFSSCVILILGYVYSKNYFHSKMYIKLKWNAVQSEIAKIFKISFPSAIQNIHGTVVHLSHVVLIGILEPNLLVIYQIFLKNNLIAFVLMFGTVQAFGLDNITSIVQRNFKQYIKSLKSFFIIYSVLLFTISMIFYFFLTFEIKHVEKNIQYYGIILGFFMMNISYYIVCIRNILIATLINLKDTVIPPFISTCLSLGLGIPLSLYLGSTIPILIGISIGVIAHYAVASFYLLKRIKHFWNT